MDGVGRTVAAAVAALALGGASAVGRDVLADRAPSIEPPIPPATRAPDPWRVPWSGGGVRVLAGARWQPAVDVPFVDVQAVASDASGSAAMFTRGPVRFLIRGDTRVGVDAHRPRLWLDGGNLVVRSQVAVETRTLRSRIRGACYAARADNDGLVIAALDGPVEVEVDGETVTVASQQELRIRGEERRVEDLPVRLGVSLARDARGIVGQTLATARVYAKRGGAYTPVPVDDDGRFRLPALLDVVAVDAAGRSAHPGDPSASIADLLRWLDGETRPELEPLATADLRWQPGTDAFRAAAARYGRRPGPPPLFDFEVPLPGR